MIAGSAEFIEQFADPGSFRSWDSPPKDPDANAEYLAELAEARRWSDVDEAVVTGQATVGGHPVAVIVSEFRFLAGSIGVVAAERILRAVERATSAGLPLVAAPASGGTRMQEGAAAFVRMAAISKALHRHQDAGLVYLVYLRHPTTGGVLASWGSLGQLTFAQPGALLGFLGPKVYRALRGSDFPRDVQTAENLHRRGLVDEVLMPGALRERVTVLLGMVSRRSESATEPNATVTHEAVAEPLEPLEPIDAWDAVLATRRADRPGLTELLRHAATDTVELSGTGEGERDPALRVALARIGGIACVVIGQDRAAQRSGHVLGPAALRQARRGMRLAAQLGLPVVTVIDTPGAALSREAEEGGLAGEIARCIEQLGSHPCPTLGVLLGQGTGGAALALLPADRVIAAQRAWLAPLPPEGASAIKHGTAEYADLMARTQGITAAELHRNGIVHRVVPESAGADTGTFPSRMAQVLAAELGDLVVRTSPRAR